MLAAFEDAVDEFADLWVDQGLAAADAHDRRAGLIDGGEAFLDRELLLDGVLVFADATAPGAGEIACVEGFQHHHEREARRALDFLLEHVACHIGGQAERESHGGAVVGYWLLVIW